MAYPQGFRRRTAGPSVSAMSDVRHDGSPAAPVRVDPPALRRNGLALAETGRVLMADGAVGPLSAATDVDCDPGWAASAAAAGAARAWREMLRTCGAELDELGERLITAADAYQRCDARAAGRTGGVRPW
jgi:hypothetical protein